MRTSALGRTPARRGIVLLGALCAVGLAAAAAGERAGGVSVQADRAEFDGRKGTIHYRGNVRLRDERRKLTFQGEELVARIAGRRLVSVTATGAPAVLRQYDEDAEIPDDEAGVGDESLRFSAVAERVVYNTEKGVIDLSGSVRVSQRGLGSLQSDSVRYAIDERRLVAGAAEPGRPSNRVLIRLPETP